MQSQGALQTLLDSDLEKAGVIECEGTLMLVINDVIRWLLMVTESVFMK